MEPEFLRNEIERKMNEPELEKLKMQALSDLHNAYISIKNYRMAKESRGLQIPLISDDFDEQVHEQVRSPFFLGPPGEVCSKCGGSGRKS